MSHGIRDRGVAVLWGLVTHGLFVVGVAGMLVNLHQGLRLGLGPLRGWPAVVANVALMAQFPLLHSFLLSRRGRRVLERLAPRPLGRDLSTTTFALVASAQLILAFFLWSPSGVVWWEPSGAVWVLHTVLFAGAWLVLGKALIDAGLASQTGAIGWLAVARGRPLRFGPFPTGGLFRWIRQPVYVGFALTLWTGPVWTPDRLALALAWTAYCVVAPRFKERRMRERHGQAYARYSARVPYMVPRPMGRPETDLVAELAGEA
jgi:protein-S-isoprenylcysteine O-methyltransferase Ste14